MPVIDELTDRIRSHLALDPRVTEKRMFGGNCFLLDGKILVAARGNGSMLVQCGAGALARETRAPGVTAMIMRGKPTANFVNVEYDVVEADEELARWIGIAERYVMAK